MKIKTHEKDAALSFYISWFVLKPVHSNTLFTLSQVEKGLLYIFVFIIQK